MFKASVLFLSALVLSNLEWAGAEEPGKVTVVQDAKEVNPGIQSFTVTSPYQKGPNELEVLLPDDYTPTKHYPVVYLLPVNTGTTGQWGSGIVEAKKQNLQNEFHFIFVAPAYEILPWFGDNPDKPEIRQDSYLLDAVIPYIDQHFSTVTKPEGRFICSFSKGGLGAWSLFLMHLDLFGQVSIFDSFDGPPTEDQWEHWGFMDTYGTRQNYDNYDPFILLPKMKDILHAQPRRITILGGGPGSRVGVDRYHTKLNDYKIPYVYIQGSNMEHNWTSGWLPLAVAALAHPTTLPYLEPK